MAAGGKIPAMTQQKGFFRLDRTLQSGGEFGMGFSASNLDQETAGFIEGKDAYKDPGQTHNQSESRRRFAKPTASGFTSA